MSVGETPRREAASRSMTTLACRPRVCWSLLTSLISGYSFSLFISAVDHLLSSCRSDDWSVYWYCDREVRPPTRMSCEATRNRFIPTTPLSFRRKAIDNFLGGGVGCFPPLNSFALLSHPNSVLAAAAVTVTVVIGRISLILIFRCGPPVGYCSHIHAPRSVLA